MSRTRAGTDAPPDVLLLTVSQAAALCQLDRNRVYELVNGGTWPAIRFGQRIRIPRRWLEEWIAAQSAPPVAPDAPTPLPLRQSR